MYLAKIYVTLKPTVNDPQGLTIKGALHTLGFTSVADVRAGKFIEVKLAENDRVSSEQKVKEMCRQLLANPVIENYRFELQEIPQSASIK
ncbi:MAG TPA: phosphoribosylformylglycinamidine synthase subunit PurS [Dehalococcoidia bacterium]|nr:phosphoribosylformylglycinamidine synthase subunit PurS [Dehalococcoidia bacterium]